MIIKSREEQKSTRNLYVSQMTVDGKNPIFVLQGAQIYLVFSTEIVKIPLIDCGFPIPAIGYVNCYFGSSDIIANDISH
jgi:hypothetical protein